VSAAEHPPATLRLALLSLGTFLVGTNGFVIAGLLPDIARGLSTTPTGVGLSITVYAAVVAVLAPTVATLLTRVPRIPLIAAGMVLTAVGTTITAVGVDLPAFVIGRAIAGAGGAAIVPTAVSVAAILVPPARRGRAIAIVTLGFTLSTAIGSPLGTAVAHVGGWRLPLAAVAVLAAISAVVVLLVVRDVPLPPPLSFANRVSVLADPRILLALGSTVFTIAAFNVLYIFSSSVTADATRGSGALLAGLLLVYGLGGVIGNQLSGRLTDRFGNRVVGSILIGVHFIALLAIFVVAPWYPASVVAFAIWGVAAFGTGIAVQDRLASIDPARATIAVSWYSTGVYVGIALAPLIGGATLAAWGPARVPLAAAAAVVGAGILFQLGYARRLAR
jgi:MFS transporter, DHA1 family, inner membrane transport protein